MSSNLRILNEEGLETLRNCLRNGNPSILKPLPDLVEEFNLELIDSPYHINKDVNLFLPESSTWEKNHDRENALLIYNSLPGFTPVHASDERFWVSLAFGPFMEYSSKRWNAESKSQEDLITLLKNHWFCPTARSRWRDHTISRLWWVGYLAHTYENLLSAQVLDVLYLNSELINSFLGHPRTTSSRRTGGMLLEIIYDQYLIEKSYKFERSSFRHLMHLVDLRGGKLQFEALPADVLKAELLNCFYESHKGSRVF
jgi:hypothetical protein